MRDGEQWLESIEEWMREWLPDELRGNLGRRVGFRGRVECFEVGDGVGGVVSMVPNPQDRSERSNPEENQTPTTNGQKGDSDGFR